MYERSQLPGSGRLTMGVTPSKRRPAVPILCKFLSAIRGDAQGRNGGKSYRRQGRKRRLNPGLVPTWTAVTTTSIASALLAGSPAGSIVSTFALTFNQLRYSLSSA